MTTINKLRKNYEFKKVYKEGRYYADKYVVIYVIKNNMGLNRIGLSVSKKVGNSVVRNRVRRRMKEIYRRFAGTTKQGYDIVFTARIGIGSVDFSVIENSMEAALKRARLQKSEE